MNKINLQPLGENKQLNEMYQPGVDILIQQSESFVMLREDVGGHGMDQTSRMLKGIEKRYADGRINWMDFKYYEPESGENSFVIGSQFKMSVLCQEGDKEIFKPVPKRVSPEGTELVVGCEPRQNRRAIVKLERSNKETNYYLFDGGAQVWDWPENREVTPVFKWHEIKYVEPISIIQGPPPHSDGTPVTKDEWTPIPMPEN